MSRILFFCIPAHGHTNPTLPLIAELTARGHEVRYFHTQEFREKIERAGAAFIDVGPYMPPAPADLEKRVGKDFASLIEMVVDTTLSLDARAAQEIADFRPDVIVSDSVCFWGKLFAKKYGVPYICSTTTLAFNQESAKGMKKRPMEIVRMILGMPRIGRKMAQLRAAGYDAPDFVSILGNDNETDTIVYTSRGFQPAAETFGERYAFVGPSVAQLYPRKEKHARPCVYVSLGTVLHDNVKFYRACIGALGSMGVDVIMSVGEKVDPAQLGRIPANIAVYPRVNQLEVLSGADLFITHCGMNSVQESLLYGVPMVCFPQHSEEYAVAARVVELGAGVRLKRPTAGAIRHAVKTILQDDGCRSAAQRIREEFLACGGAAEAADFIERVVSR